MALGTPTPATDIRELRRLDAAGDTEAVLAGLRVRIAEDPRVFAKPFVRDWVGRRWRSLFLDAVAADPAAVREAGHASVPGTDLTLPRLRDSRSGRQKIAERFLHGSSVEVWRTDQPPFMAELPTRTTVVLCPGLINTLIPVHSLADALPKLADTGVPVMRARAHPMRSCEDNIADYVATLERGEGLDAAGTPIRTGGARPPKDVILVGYSKGGPDAATLVANRPDLAGRVRAVVGWAGAFGGSHAADGLLAKLPTGTTPISGETLATAVRALAPVLDLDRLPERLDEYDVRGAIASLTTAGRAAWTVKNKAKLTRTGVPFLTISAVAPVLEVPYFQAQGSTDIAKKSGANDMQLSIDQSSMPVTLSAPLGEIHCHHWDIGYPSFPRRYRLGSPNLRHPFPRYAAILGVVQVLAELGMAE